MDSRAVNREIRDRIRPLLKDWGFTQFTARNSWRYNGTRIDVINFQSFNSYNAGVMGCTTYSFSVNVGSFFTEIPDQYDGSSLKAKDNQLRPQEYHCTFRGSLRRGFPQPEYEDDEIWYIDPDGRYLEKAVDDAGAAIANHGQAWFDRLSKPGECLRILKEDDERLPELWGFGRNPSPVRHYLIGYFALRAGHKETAARHLSEALASGCFAEVGERIQSDIEACGLTIDSSGRHRGVVKE